MIDQDIQLSFQLCFYFFSIILLRFLLFISLPSLGLHAGELFFLEPIVACSSDTRLAYFLGFKIVSSRHLHMGCMNEDIIDFRFTNMAHISMNMMIFLFNEKSFHISLELIMS